MNIKCQVCGRFFIVQTKRKCPHCKKYWEDVKNMECGIIGEEKW